MTGATAGLALLIVVSTSTGCQSSTPGSAPNGQLQAPTMATVGDSLPRVTVSAGRAAQAIPDRTAVEIRLAQTSVKPTAPSWYVTTVKDPVRGVYTAAVERQSLSRLVFHAPSDEEPRALLALVLLDGRPRDIVLSLEGGEFECIGRGQGNACAIQVSVDGAPPTAVRFSVPRHWAAARLHLAGGADAHRLLVAIGTAKSLIIQPTFKNEKPADLEFALTGLRAAIAKVVKHSVAATHKLAGAPDA